MTINSMNTESIAPGKAVLMPPVKVDPAKVKTFENAVAFYGWLCVHPQTEDEVWIRIYKVGSGLPLRGLAIAGDRIVTTLVESTGNIWMAAPPGR
jgi:hypothetical protein